VAQDAKPNLSLLGVLWQEISSVRHFSKMFWLVAASAVVNYAVVMVWNNTAQGLLLQRNLFKPAQDLAACCCWAEGSCYTSWPSGHLDDSGNYEIHIPSATELQQCRTGCVWDADRAPALNLTTSQTDHLDCEQEAPLYGLEAHNDPPISVDNTWLKAYCDRQSSAQLTAGLWMSIPYYINVGSSPVAGFLVDRFGQCATVMAAASAIFTVVHVLLGLTQVNALVLLLGQGVAYSAFAAAMWPPVVYIVEEQYIGAAYGVITAMMNTGFAVFPLISSQIYAQNGDSYLPSVELFFSGLAALGTIVGVALLVEDSRIGRPFNRVHWFDSDETAKETAEAPQ